MKSPALIRLSIFFSLLSTILLVECFTHSGYLEPPETNEIRISGHCVSVPLGSILLVRKESVYCAIKITKAWTGSNKEDQFAEYESCYQDDKSGDFSKRNVRFERGQLSYPRGIWIGGLHSLRWGVNQDISCGPMKLLWSYKSWIYFFAGKQYGVESGIELAPSKWSDISEVNVFDPRLKWYRYDESRKTISIPIENLW